MVSSGSGLGSMRNLPEEAGLHHLAEFLIKQFGVVKLALQRGEAGRQETLGKAVEAFLADPAESIDSRPTRW